MKRILLTAFVAASVGSLKADDGAFQASLTPDLAIHSRTTQIDGVALSFWGENPQRAFALGFVNGSTGQSKGLSLGLGNYADSYAGFACAFINVSHHQFVGWQNGMVNYSEGTFTGLQTGGINITEECHGLQVGFVNCSENLRGVQIGLANIALNNPLFTEFPDKFAPGIPFLNWSF